MSFRVCSSFRNVLNIQSQYLFNGSLRISNPVKRFYSESPNTEQELIQKIKVLEVEVKHLGERVKHDKVMVLGQFLFGYVTAIVAAGLSFQHIDARIRDLKDIALNKKEGKGGKGGKGGE